MSCHMDCMSILLGRKSKICKNDPWLDAFCITAQTRNKIRSEQIFVGVDPISPQSLQSLYLYRVRIRWSKTFSGQSPILVVESMIIDRDSRGNIEDAPTSKLFVWITPTGDFKKTHHAFIRMSMAESLSVFCCVCERFWVCVCGWLGKSVLVLWESEKKK